ncbi:MAG: hypothetical protein R3B95_13235 [Nitrospirales bacterium]|nr:hypothetical protein [Nitrospirales bacterium]
MTSLRENFYHSFIGNGLFSLGMWLNISVIAKLASVEAVGDYALANAIVSPLFGFFSLNIRAAVVTDVKGQFNFREYFATRIVTTYVCVLFILLIALGLGTTYEFGATMLFLTIAKFAEAFCDIRYALSQKLNQLKPIGISMGLRGVAGFLGLTLGLLLSGGLPVGLACLAVSWITVYFLYDRPISEKQLNKAEMEPEFSSVKSIVLHCLPLGILLLINLSINNIPRYFVSSWLDQKALGYFAATTYFIFIGGIFINAFALPLSRRFSEYFIDDINRFKLLLMSACGVALLVGACGVLLSVYFGEPILKLLYTEEYAEYSYLLIWSMVASIPLYCSVILGTAITATRKFQFQMIANIPIPIITVGFLFFMGGEFTLVAGVQAILVAYFTKFIVQAGLIVYLMLSKAAPSTKQRLVHKLEEVN